MAFAAYLCLLKVVADQRHRWLWVVFLLFLIHTILFRSIGRSGYVVFIGLWCLFFTQKLGYKGLVLAIISSVLFLFLAYNYSPVFKGRSELMVRDVKTYHQNDNTSVGLRISFVKNSTFLFLYTSLNILNINSSI